MNVKTLISYSVLCYDLNDQNDKGLMTLIAEFLIQNQPILIGDLVLSGPELADSVGGLPTIGDTRKVFPKGSGTTIIRTAQKLNILSDNLIIAWAGNAYVAKTVIEDLKELTVGESFTFDTLKHFLAEFQQSKDKNKAVFVGCMVQGTEMLSFNLGGTRFESGLYGEVFAAGTGTKDVAALLEASKSPQLFSMSGTPGPALSAISRALIVTSTLLQLELTTHSTLLQYYGGGYEVATLIGGKFAKIGDISYLFWVVDASSAKIFIRFPYHAIKVEYWNELLAFRIARIAPDLRFEDEVHVVGPIYGTGTDDKTLRRVPDLNSRFLVNSFLVLYEDGSSEWMARVDYQRNPGKHILFHEINGGFKIEIQKKFIDTVGQSVKRRIQERSGAAPPDAG